MAEDSKSRRQAEIALLSSMYPNEFRWDPKKPPRADPVSSRADHAQSLDILSREDDLGDEEVHFSLILSESFTLEFTIPTTYPGSGGVPIVYLSCGGKVDTHSRKIARNLIAQVVKEENEAQGSDDGGGEVLDLIIQRCMESLDSIPTSTDSLVDEENDKNNKKAAEETVYKRVVIWTHHLLSTAKRKSIVSWGSELHLTGFSRPGYPGGIFAEGEVGEVDEFVDRLKGMKWQALQVRDFETGKARLLKGTGVMEVEGLGELTERLGDDGCKKMFLDGMKIGVGG